MKDKQNNIAKLLMSTTVTHFKGLNGLRAIAATMVLFWHANSVVFPNGTRYNPLWHFISQNGSNAVSLFFVLSGFLISYLLLGELKKNNTIHIRNFYLKRILRIWPIYYLIIIIVQVILPLCFYAMGKEYKTVSNFSMLFYIVILPNISYAIADTGKMGHLWSIGVEEQFYLLWAPLVSWLKTHFLFLCISVITIKFLALKLLVGSTISPLIIAIIKTFQFEKMAIGGLGAYLVFYHQQKTINSRLFSPLAQIVIIGLLSVYMAISEPFITNLAFKQVYHFLFVNCSFLLIPFLFLYLIINVSINSRALFTMENKAMNFLGTISYGFYVYHMVSLFATEFVLNTLHVDRSTSYYCVVFYAIAISLNLLMSYVSFYYFESKILKYRPIS